MTKKPQTTGASPKNHDTLRGTTAGEQPYIPVNITVRAKRKPRTPQLTYKQRKLVELVASGKTKKEAYREAYGSSGNDNTVSVQANRVLRNAHVQRGLEAYTSHMETALVQAVTEAQRRLPGASDRDSAPLLTVVERISNSVLDRVHGKATQRVQVQSTGVVLTLDLSGYSGSLDDTTEVETEKQTDSELL